MAQVKIILIEHITGAKAQYKWNRHLERLNKWLSKGMKGAQKETNNQES